MATKTTKVLDQLISNYLAEVRRQLREAVRAAVAIKGLAAPPSYSSAFRSASANVGATSIVTTSYTKAIQGNTR